MAAMPSALRIELLATRSDFRGQVFEPLTALALGSQRNVHVVLSQPGAVRGNHYHRYGTETLVVVGPARVRLRLPDDLQELRILDGQVYRLVLPPGIGHAIQHTGPGPGVLVAFNTQEHDPANCDTVPELLIEPTTLGGA